jgi:DnaJ family protein C protein 28
MEDRAHGIDEAIRRAIEAGDFDNLPGRGRPLHLENNPHEDPTWSLALHLLKENDFTLPWIADRQGIESDLDAACQKLKLAWNTYQLNPGDTVTWQQAQAAFREQVAWLNKRIRDFNISVPSDHFQRLLVNPEREIEKICSG